MIHNSFLWLFNKYFFRKGGVKQNLTAFFTSNPTFLSVFTRKNIPQGGDVTRRETVKNPGYAVVYAVLKVKGEDGEREEIPVDNSQFSTLSTSLSTGLFHRGTGLWIFTF